MADNSMAMQMRCVNCKREQYAPAVLAISNGEHGCVWCGHVPPVLTVDEYRARFRRAASSASPEGNTDPNA